MARGDGAQSWSASGFRRQRPRGGSRWRRSSGVSRGRGTLRLPRSPAVRGHPCTEFPNSIHTRDPFVARLGYNGQWDFEDLTTGRFIALRGTPGVITPDVDGDGIPGIVRRFQNSLFLYRRAGVKSDVLQSVKDSRGAQTRVAYGALVDPSVHTRTTDDNCTYPFSCPKGGRWLVRDVFYDAGLAEPSAERRVTHTYEDARSSRDGRGFLGFAAHVMSESGRTTRYEMRNTARSGRFLTPYARRVHRTLTEGSLEQSRLTH